ARPIYHDRVSGAKVGDKLADKALALLNIDADDHQTVVFVLFESGDQLREFDSTGNAPGGPEVQNDRFAAVVTETHYLSVEVEEGEVRSRRAFLGFAAVAGPELYTLGLERVEVLASRARPGGGLD